MMNGDWTVMVRCFDGSCKYVYRNGERLLFVTQVEAEKEAQALTAKLPPSTNGFVTQIGYAVVNCSRYA